MDTRPDEASRSSTTAMLLRDRGILLSELRHAGPLAVAALLVAQLVIGFVPAVTALVMTDLVDRLLGGEPTTAALVVLGLVVLAGQLSQTWSAPAAYLVGQRIDVARRAALTRLAVSSDHVDALEQPRVRDLFRVARADPEFWAERTPGTGATAQLGLVIRWLGVAAAAVVLAGFAWWLAPLVIVPAIVSRSMWRRQFMEHIGIERAGVQAGVEADHWRRLAVEWTDGKESRTFGLPIRAPTSWSLTTSASCCRSAVSSRSSASSGPGSPRW